MTCVTMKQYALHERFYHRDDSIISFKRKYNETAAMANADVSLDLSVADMIKLTRYT